MTMSASPSTTHINRRTSRVLKTLTVEEDSPVQVIIDKIDEPRKRLSSKNSQDGDHLGLFSASSSTVDEADDNSVEYDNDDDDDDDERRMSVDINAVDPRVGGALEALNDATDRINQIELDLVSYKTHHKRIMKEVSIKLNEILEPYGMKHHVERASAYYMAADRLLSIQRQALRIATEFEKNSEEMAKVKNTYSLEPTDVNERNVAIILKRREILENKFSHVTTSVMGTRKEVDNFLEERMYHIEKARTYFETKKRLEKEVLEAQRKIDRVTRQQEECRAIVAKRLKFLADLSNDIHQSRKNSPSVTNFDSFPKLTSSSTSDLPSNVVRDRETTVGGYASSISGSVLPGVPSLGNSGFLGTVRTPASSVQSSKTSQDPQESVGITQSNDSCAMGLSEEKIDLDGFSTDSLDDNSNENNNKKKERNTIATSSCSGSIDQTNIEVKANTPSCIANTTNTTSASAAATTTTTTVNSNDKNIIKSGNNNNINKTYNENEKYKNSPPRSSSSTPSTVSKSSGAANTRRNVANNHNGGAPSSPMSPSSSSGFNLSFPDILSIHYPTTRVNNNNSNNNSNINNDTNHHDDNNGNNTPSTQKRISSIRSSPMSYCV